MVPSVEIHEGVFKKLQITEQHLWLPCRYRFSIYESKNFAEEAPDFSAGKYVGWEIS